MYECTMNGNSREREWGKKRWEKRWDEKYQSKANQIKSASMPWKLKNRAIRLPVCLSACLLVFLFLFHLHRLGVFWFLWLSLWYCGDLLEPLFRSMSESGSPKRDYLHGWVYLRGSVRSCKTNTLCMVWRISLGWTSRRHLISSYHGVGVGLDVDVDGTARTLEMKWDGGRVKRRKEGIVTLSSCSWSREIISSKPGKQKFFKCVCLLADSIASPGTLYLVAWLWPITSKSGCI